jgi:hypothetical protein
MSGMMSAGATTAAAQGMTDAPISRQRPIPRQKKPFGRCCPLTVIPQCMERLLTNT